MRCKVLLSLVVVVLAASASAKTINLKNVYDVPIVASISGEKNNIVLNPGQQVSVEKELGWSGQIWANRAECQNITCNNPATLVEFDFVKDPKIDFYDVSLVDGFNFVVKVVPYGDVAQCKATVCQAQLLKLCPEDNQVLDSNNKVIACKSEPQTFQKYCPLAIITALDDGKVFSCQGSEEFLVLWG